MNCKVGDEFICLDNVSEYARHICLKRYFLALRYAEGFVIDAACGPGYGSELLSNSERVTSVLGVDYNAKLVELANERYRNSKLKFEKMDIKEALRSNGLACDWLVSIETIEHLGLERLPLMAKQVRRGLFFSVPYLEKPGTFKWHVVPLIHEEMIKKHLAVEEFFWMDANTAVYYKPVVPDSNNPVTLFGVWRKRAGRGDTREGG